MKSLRHTASAEREVVKMVTKNDMIELDYVKRYPDSERTRKWRKKRVNIFAEGQGFWRPQGQGYTAHAREGWALPFETALAYTAHIGTKDSKIEFHLAGIPGNKL